MRLRHPSGRVVHLSCEISAATAGNLPSVVSQLDTYGAVRARLGADAFGVSLWLPPTLAAALAVESRARTRLRAELDARRLEVVTLSGAPFDEGGGETPRWDQPTRREYTLDLARILLDLLDEDAVRGTVSTIGLGPREGWAEAEEKAALGILRRLSHGLADLAWQNGRAVRVGFIPAPGLVLDSPEQTVAGLSRIDRDRLGVCLDLGHAARNWPDPAAGIETITDAGLSIVEVRLNAVAGSTTESWREGLRQLFGRQGPLTENLTLVSRASAVEQIAGDVTYLLAELAALGLAPENEPCPAR
ncbi:TIM barrel protein [Actinoplanes bogorensis]|uniref:TIM barrel protein n=1 Tax=Paractinoplanes bogorensis TaxID=1610840 RepID=A0ABS5Z2L4_9ACTN|nr:TIM barrel protein [Actinoplanes bogorensis]MBU2669940.1 TIM barrel protein [Actinoplanes bogorensis]